MSIKRASQDTEAPLAHFTIFVPLHLPRNILPGLMHVEALRV